MYLQHAVDGTQGPVRTGSLLRVEDAKGWKDSSVRNSQKKMKNSSLITEECYYYCYYRCCH